MALVAVLSSYILVSHGRTRCRLCWPAFVAIANNVLKAGRHGTGSLSARMLFGETLTTNLIELQLPIRSWRYKPREISKRLLL